MSARSRKVLFGTAALLFVAASGLSADTGTSAVGSIDLILVGAAMVGLGLALRRRRLSQSDSSQAQLLRSSLHGSDAEADMIV